MSKPRATAPGLSRLLRAHLAVLHAGGRRLTLSDAALAHAWLVDQGIADVVLGTAAAGEIGDYVTNPVGPNFAPSEELAYMIRVAPAAWLRERGIDGWQETLDVHGSGAYLLDLAGKLGSRPRS